MILSPVSLLDCLVFVILLIPQLFVQLGIITTLKTVLQISPFLLLRLPLSLISERFLLPYPHRPPFVRRSTFFQDLVIRCTRYAFSKLPYTVGGVFFSAPVAHPWLRFRLLRHGYLKSPIYYRSITGRQHFKGLWLAADELKAPDIVIYYAHGGGFAMGSSYFYLEFLLTLVHLLKTEGGFENPAVLALEYTLAPEGTWPQQLNEALEGYEHVLNIVDDSSKVCLAGDSAGATIMLSMLLALGTEDLEEWKPGYASLISPWCTLSSPEDENTASDFLDADVLHDYAEMYARSKVQDKLVSPGKCRDMKLWKRASPGHGFQMLYGSEEVFAKETKKLGQALKDVEIEVEEFEEEGGIHAWPIVDLFLGSKEEERLRGMREMVQAIRTAIGETY